MTVFLTVVDRRASRGIEADQYEQEGQDLLRNAARRFSPYLGSDYNSQPRLEALTGRDDLFTVYWSRNLSEGEPARSENFWALTAGHPVSQNIADYVRPRGGKLEFTRPVWGYYSAILATTSVRQLYAWNSTPALESINWAATDKYVFISNRPLLAAFGLSESMSESTPELSLDFLTEYLLYGYSLSGRTPFEKVYTLSVKDALSVVDGEVRLIPTPSGLQTSLSVEHSLDDGIEALETALSNAMARTERHLNGRPVQLRLSGGKDSRLLLALLKDRNIDFRTVTFGNESSVDVKLASHLNDLLGAEGEMRAPRLNSGSNIFQRVITTLQECGGIPASEPHTAQYRGADVEQPHEAIMMGHWPLYKGGMANRLGLSEKEVNHVLKWQGKNLLKADIRAPFDAHLHQWSKRLAVSDNIEKLYLFAREFRSGRYLHSHVNQYSGGAVLAYPLADAEVAVVCDALSMEEKVTEKALFGALGRLWPEIMKVPLDRAKWRFEKEGPDPEFSGPWYEQRYASIPEAKPRKITRVPRANSEYSDEAMKEMARQLVKSENVPLFAELLTPRLQTAINKIAEGVVAVPEGMTRALLAKFIWRVFVADAWWSKEWVHAH